MIICMLGGFAHGSHKQFANHLVLRPAPAFGAEPAEQSKNGVIPAAVLPSTSRTMAPGDTRTNCIQ